MKNDPPIARERIHVKTEPIQEDVVMGETRTRRQAVVETHGALPNHQQRTSGSMSILITTARRAEWIAGQSNQVVPATARTLSSPMLFTPQISSTRLRGKILGAAISTALASSFQWIHLLAAVGGCNYPI